MEICNGEMCTGCAACVSVCPKGCIEMVEDEIGHFIPAIDEKKCINCGACQKICHNNYKVECNTPKKSYAAVSLDIEDYKTSSSGGVASVFSKYFIENGGVVYGCTGQNGYDICHIRVDNIDELKKLKGSKYVESRLGDTYKNIKNDLIDGKKVLFIGTPCQCAGVKSLFGKYENFYSVDLICHGVPSQKLLREHLKIKVKETPDEIGFREGLYYNLYTKKDKNYSFRQDIYLNAYYTGFNKSLFLRNSCYQCKYANSKRCADITIGDFRGVKNSKLLNKYSNGISVVLINTPKGNEIFNSCKEYLEFEEHEVKEVIEVNPQLRQPSTKHKNTDKFRILYKKYGFKKAANKCLLINRIKYLILFVYMKFLRR